MEMMCIYIYIHRGIFEMDTVIILLLFFFSFVQ